MYHNFYSHKLNLQLFAEAGPAGGNGAAGAEGSGVNAPAAGVQTGVETAPNTGDGAPSPEVQKVDRKAEFEKLIKGEYKDLFDARMRDTVQKRLKGPAEAAEKYKALSPALELLAKRYNVADPTDVKALTAAIEADDDLMESLAMEENMSVENYREFRRLKQQNQEFQKREAERQRNEAAKRTYDRWTQQAEEAKRFYPSLDLETEIQNPAFRDLIQSPYISVRTAYEAVHSDEINAGLLRHATQVAAQQVAASVAANGARPNENGAGAQAATVKIDPSKMTKAQRQEYILRAARGEKIVL